MSDDKLRRYLQTAPQQQDLARTQRLTRMLQQYAQSVAAALTTLQEIARLRRELGDA